MKIKKFFTVKNSILLVVGLAIFAVSFFGVRYLVTTMKAVSGLPGVAIEDPSSNSALTAEETPVAIAPQVALPPTWDGGSRVTVLLLGVDTEIRVGDDGRIRPDRTGPARSDTMILLTIDPQTMTAGMLSIPRDLWVNIPGFDYAKINTAYYNGEAFKLPGGGPALAMRAVEQVIGVPVQYYAQMQFWAFTQLIDDIDKITVNVPKKIFIDPVGSGPDDIMLSAGEHKLGGVEALAYVRARHTNGGDVDRSQRQQDVIMAFRNKVLDPANFTKMLGKAPKIYDDIQSGVLTNLTFNDIMQLGMLAKDIDIANIKKGVITYDMVLTDNVVVNGENQAIMIPIPDEIRVLRDEIFGTNNSTKPLAVGTNQELAIQEGARIGIYNASSVPGLAERTSEYLKGQGFNIVSVENASYYPGVTQVIDHRGSLYVIKYFQELFSLNAGAQIGYKLDAAAPVDIELVIADDWALNNPMP
jgi:LCP family protein required for cell wall assembly